MKKLLVILFFPPIFLEAQSRLYLSQVVPPYTPAVNAAWNVTTGALVGMLYSQVGNEATLNQASGNTGAAAVRKLLFYQFISQPLQAQTLNGTLTGQTRFNMSSTTSRTGEAFVYLRLMNIDGTIANETGTLTSTALTTTLTNRTLIALTISSLSITAGQRLVVDMGWNYSTGSNTTTSGTMTIRDNRTNADYPVDNTTTALNTSWIEFSQKLIFQKRTYGFF